MNDSFNGYEAPAIPHDPEVEEAVLGSILIAPAKLAILKAFLNGSDFFILRHKYIWEACVRVVDRGDALDYLSLKAELQAVNHLGDIGGPAYLTQLINNTPTSIHAETYGRVVQRAAVRRQMLAARDEIGALAVDETISTEHARAEMNRIVAQINGVDLTLQQKGLQELLSNALDHVEYRMVNPRTFLGIPTGFTQLDALLLGMQKSDLTVIGAVPGMGKTSYILSEAHNAAQAGARVGFISQEMGADQITNRLLSLESGVNLQAVRSGQMTSAEFTRFTAAAGRLALLKNNLRIHAGTVTPESLRGLAMKWASEGGLDILYVDYLQIMSSGGLFKPSERVGAVGYFAESLKKLALEMNISVRAPAQLNREIANRPDKRPYLSDLRESGAIEQNADIVLFIHRDEYYNPGNSEFPNQAQIIIGKHRNGPTGEVTLYFEKTLTKFMNAAERSVDLSHM